MKPYRKNALEDHPWAGWAEAQADGRAPGAMNRWNAGKDMTWEPLRPESVCEVSYDHLQHDRFRHATSLVRWRPDREPVVVHLRAARHPGADGTTRRLRDAPPTNRTTRLARAATVLRRGRPRHLTHLHTASSLGLSEVAKMSNEEIMELAAESARRMASQAGLIVQLAGELDRREGWRAEGATSLESWMVERLGVSVPTARAFAHVAERLFDLPHLAAGLSSGDLSFDKVRAVVDGATPESDGELRDQAMEHSVRELAQLARSRRPASTDTARADHESRFLRFNESFRTLTAQLPAETFAEVRGTLEAQARELPSDGRDPLGPTALRHLRRHRPLLPTARAGTATPFTVVAHVPLETLARRIVASSLASSSVTGSSAATPFAGWPVTRPSSSRR